MFSQLDDLTNYDVKRVMTAPAKKKKKKNILKSPNTLKKVTSVLKTFQSEKDCRGNPILWMRKSKHQKQNSKDVLSLKKKIFLMNEEENEKKKENKINRINKFNNVDLKETEISSNNININNNNNNKTIEEVLVSSSNELLKANNNTISEEKEKKESSDDKFMKSLSNRCDIDQYLHKTIQCKNIIFIPGEKIHEGPETIIYKCINLKTGEIFACKYFKNCMNNKNYEKEIEILKELNHPNIIKYLGNEIINNNIFLFMEHASNGNLKRIIDNFGPFNESLIKIYLKQIIEGLKYLHDKGIIHRDLKCLNLLLNNNKILIADFGTSKKNNNENKEDKINESSIGTINWSAPEVICHKKYSIKADIWSLGCTIIEMNTGKIPWSEKKFDNIFQAINAIGRGNDIPLIPNGLSYNLKDLILLCLNRDDKLRGNCDILLKHPFFSEE